MNSGEALKTVKVTTLDSAGAGSAIKEGGLKKRGCVVLLLLRLFVVAPIWFYMVYKVLLMIGATELMWFLFWVYVPVTILAMILAAACDYSKETKP